MLLLSNAPPWMIHCSLLKDMYWCVWDTASAAFSFLLVFSWIALSTGTMDFFFAATTFHLGDKGGDTSAQNEETHFSLFRPALVAQWNAWSVFLAARWMRHAVSKLSISRFLSTNSIEEEWAARATWASDCWQLKLFFVSCPVCDRETTIGSYSARPRVLLLRPSAEWRRADRQQQRRDFHVL